jgi:ADP-L-glycero-D-manno-heptose 6-epimerase
MIIITGAAGMIGSVAAWHYNEKFKETDIVLCDDMPEPSQENNFNKRKYKEFVLKDKLFKFLKDENPKKIDAVIHMGAISATTEKNFAKLIKNNIRFSQDLWNYCSTNKIPFIYASSAATYGNGLNGYDDEQSIDLKPLNAYGYSKYFFDNWVISNQLNGNEPPLWAGLKFFNVYGPNEYHKKRMSSVVFHAFNQIKETGVVKLFKSNEAKYTDGGQLRDFIYVKDAVKAMMHLLKSKKTKGIFNIGTGKAQSFNQLAKAIIKNYSKKNCQIKYINMPSDLNEKYQNFTEAKIAKLRHSGYDQDFMALDEGVTDYYQNYLIKEDPYL